MINAALAQIFRERCSLDAVAETMHGGRRPDIVVRLPDGPVVVETELDPAPTVDADALSRLGMEIDGRKVQNVFAVSVPSRLRATGQRQLEERMAGATLSWQEWRIDGTSGPKLSGSPIELGNVLQRTRPPAGDLDYAVSILDDGARSAGSRLYSSPGSLGRVARVFGAEPGDEAANMAALIIINAMVFQERLADDSEAFEPVDASREGPPSQYGSESAARAFSKRRLLESWEYILSVNYYPIFGMAHQVVDGLSEAVAREVLGECATTTADLLASGAVGRHDLAGRIFNRLVSERELLAAFYTSIPASTLLAGLALSPSRHSDVDWSDVDQVGRLRVVDPACGTGALLMAAYRQMLQNSVAAGSPIAGDAALHRALVERVITGADVVQAAIHLTAATLAAMSPSVKFEQMQLHTLRLGRDSDDKIWLGSLDWLEAPETQSFFSATEEQIGAKSGYGSVVRHPEANVVISNPPYTRRGSDSGHAESLARVFSLPESDEESQAAIANRTSELLSGTPANQMAGHASSFTVLADRLVNAGGRIALVLPVTALAGESWRKIRKMLSCKYEIEFVVTSHDPELRSMSYDTSIAEALLVARKLTADERASGRGVFVNLWRAPKLETDALALVRAIDAAAGNPLHRYDGPPVGGTPLTLGGEVWGEILEGPVDASHWKASRWRRALTGQFASALERGELWNEYGSQVVARVPVSKLQSVCNVGPQHRMIRGSLGAFYGHHGWNPEAQFPALWSLDSNVHNGLIAEPNAWLVPQPGRDHIPVWSQAGALHVATDVRYTSQPIMAAHTPTRTLGVSSWHTLVVNEDDHAVRSAREAALQLWCNSSLGLLLHANHASRTQAGRGRGNKAMLATMSTLDVRELASWQLEEARSIWRDFSGRKFKPFYRCAVDPARIELDGRVVQDMLGLGEDAVASLSRIRLLLAGEPSIHGGQRPDLP